MFSWAALLDEVNAKPELQPACDAFLMRARELAKLEIVRRVYNPDEIASLRSLDKRGADLNSGISGPYALAQSDANSCGMLAQDELPTLAAAFRLSGTESYRTRVIAQLDEMATWQPLQRAGWAEDGNASDGNDGNWLGTGWGIRAIADALEIMPPASIPDELRARLEALLAAEIAAIVQDWEEQRPWFVQFDNPRTTEWVVPTEGLVRACLVLGPSRYPDAYTLGVANLMRALDAHGASGEFEEGLSYAGVTAISLLHAARPLALAGDTRALTHPFLARFPTWYVHHLQPDEMLINAFDAGNSARGMDSRLTSLLSLLAVCTNSPVARWAVSHYFRSPSSDIAGLCARTLPAVGADAAPPLFAAYERATRVNWRSGWQQDASSVWVRGGHETDQHDHQDRGHVNFIAHGKPLLIEAGAPPTYALKYYRSHYASGAGHNVLQLGVTSPAESDHPTAFLLPAGWQRRGRIAPITVDRLDQSGGQLTVDGSECYEGLTQWRRHVGWTADSLEVIDEVKLPDTQPQVLLFRWHLAAEEAEVVEEANGRFTVRWPDATLTLEASVPAQVMLEKMPDHTLDPFRYDHQHTCVVVRTLAPAKTLTLTTRMVAMD